MGIMKCPECGKEIANSSSHCPECGYPIIVENNRTKIVDIQSAKESLKSLRLGLIIIAIICFLTSGVFFSKSFNVKNEYYNSESYSALNKNAYVGGDAYNYIINGNYFTGYSVIASSFLLSGVMLVVSCVNVTIKMKE